MKIKPAFAALAFTLAGCNQSAPNAVNRDTLNQPFATPEPKQDNEPSHVRSIRTTGSNSAVIVGSTVGNVTINGKKIKAENSSSLPDDGNYDVDATSEGSVVIIDNKVVKSNGNIKISPQGDITIGSPKP